jgi:hypothetical protein
MSRYFRALLVACSLLLLNACSGERPPVQGFVLPEGNIAAGRANFLALGCVGCHTVVGEELPQPADAKFSVKLGGETMRVRHYGDLLTSIVNPSHRVFPQYRDEAESSDEKLSPMPDFTTQMTVAQLIDLVEFLNSKYTTMPQYAGRYYYYPGH